MRKLSIIRPWQGPALAVQIVVLLTAGLVVAQLVTLLLTLLLPPEPTPQYTLSSVAKALRGEGSDRKFEHMVQADAPELRGRGWLVSERSRRELAELLGVDPADVRLSFYTPLPFAGTVATRKLAMADDGAELPGDAAHFRPASFVVEAVDGTPAATGRFARGRLGAQHPTDGDGTGVARNPWRSAAPRAEGGRWEGRGHIRIDESTTTPPDGTTGGVIDKVVRSERRVRIEGDRGQTIPPLLRAPSGAQVIQPVPTAEPDGSIDKKPVGATPLIRRSLDMIGRSNLLPVNPSSSQLDPVLRVPAESRPAIIVPQADLIAPPAVHAYAPVAGAPSPAASPAPAPVVGPPPATVAEAAAPMSVPTGTEEDVTSPSSYSSTPPVRQRGLFGLAPAPFVEGDFIAAMRMADGRWSVVQPAPPPFLNTWQRRVLLWFLIAFAIVAPLGWLFARRMSKPLERFAEAAEQLGRDPTADVLDLDGPAEVGRAAHAFNLMQNRLRSFVSDRTAMIGAISHDLRTPLTRLRFRVEEIDDDRMREGMVEELEEMEAMISSVLNFIRDASIPGVREKLDLRTIVEDVAEDAAFIGNPVTVDPLPYAPVEIDVMAMRRLFANLIDNAVKYGDRARICLRTDRGEAYVAVIDEGPGLPEEDLERAFEPFYRSTSAQIGGKRGNGLGLAVCRSIARAHGGDVRLYRTSEGFKAELKLPLAYGANDALAA
ncbi:ATP-binding protein [Rhizorhabdus dicambivorans]|nr:ATP-binding protein [Rhizorhabdus dicambivorans]